MRALSVAVMKLGLVDADAVEQARKWGIEVPELEVEELSLDQIQQVLEFAHQQDLNRDLDLTHTMLDAAQTYLKSSKPLQLRVSGGEKLVKRQTAGAWVGPGRIKIVIPHTRVLAQALEGMEEAEAFGGVSADAVFDNAIWSVVSAVPLYTDDVANFFLLTVRERD